MQYFVIMLNFHTGLEAIVHPEDTRRKTIERVREALGDGKEIAFIHSVHDGVVEDVTAELIEAADYRPERQEIDMQAMRWDRERDARKIDDGSYTGDPRLARPIADLRKHHVEEV